MYGFVNTAIRRYVIEQESEAVWKEIVARAGFDTDEFDVTTYYEDSTTIALVGAIAAAEECDVAAVLKNIGRYWVSYAATTSFANLLTMAGNNFEQIITNLDNVHGMIKVSLPDFRPPSFTLKRLDDGCLEVFYSSERAGLFPFVDGLFEGLGHRCHQKITVLDFEQLSRSSAKWTVRVEAASSHAA